MSQDTPHWKTRMGQGLEKLSHDVFDALRWMFTIGVVRMIALQSGSNLALALSYALSVVLFLFLMSIFLLRGNVTVFRGTTRKAQSGNMAVNLTICTAAFASCLWLTYEMVELFIAFELN